MYGEMRGSAGSNLTALIGGILDDLRELFRQETALARTELKQAADQAKSTAISFGACVVCAVVGVILASFMGVHLLYELAGEGSAAEGLPLWGCFGIFALIFLSAGAALFLMAKRRGAKVDVVPHQTVETVKENVKWIKSP